MAAIGQNHEPPININALCNKGSTGWAKKKNQAIWKTELTLLLLNIFSYKLTHLFSMYLCTFLPNFMKKCWTEPKLYQFQKKVQISDSTSIRRNANSRHHQSLPLPLNKVFKSNLFKSVHYYLIKQLFYGFKQCWRAFGEKGRKSQLIVLF